jgi:hypothetical protein
MGHRSADLSYTNLPCDVIDLADAFIRSDLKPFIQPFTHRQRSQPRRATASSSGAAGVRCLTQRHNNTLLGEAGDRTRNLKVTKQPALPPEPRSPPLPLKLYIHWLGCGGVLMPELYSSHSRFAYTTTTSARG